MNKLVAVLSFYLLVLIIPQRVYSQDGIHPFFQTESSVSLLIEASPVILPGAARDFLPLIRLRRGVSDNTALTFKAGYDGQSLYMGSDIRNVWLPNIDLVQVEMAGGIHWFYDPGIKAGTIVSYNVNPFYLYGGVDALLWATRPGTRLMLLMPAGVAIPLINNRLQFLFEAGIPLTDTAKPLQSVTFSLIYKL